MSAQVLVSKTQNRHFGAKVPFLPDRLTYVHVPVHINNSKQTGERKLNNYVADAEGRAGVTCI